MHNIEFGQGPSIAVIHLDGAFGFYQKSTNNPYVISNILNIDADYVRGLEQANLPETIQATEFLLAVTVLHELVHYGRAAKGLDIDDYEYGTSFEFQAYGLRIYKGNAKEFSLKFYKK